MPYVERDPYGQIVAIHADACAQAQEELATDHPDVRKFLAGTGGSHAIQEQLSASDLGLIRVLEDLIALLIDKRIIMLTDFPLAAQHKLARRYDLRSQLADLGGIVGDQEEIPLP